MWPSTPPFDPTNNDKSDGSPVNNTAGAGISDVDGTPTSPLNPIALGIPNVTPLSRRAPSLPPLLLDNLTTATLVNTVSQFERLLEFSEKLQGKETMSKASRSAIVLTLTEKHLSGSSKSGSSFHSAKSVNAIREKDSKPLPFVIKN
jgi:hypothetical protein